MIKLAFITKDKPRFCFPQFLNLLRDTDEFNNIIIKDDNERIFDVLSVYLDDDLDGLKNSKNYSKIKDDLYIDDRTIPKYIPEWELEEFKNILATYYSIALEDLKSHR